MPNVFLFFCSLPVRVKELASTFGQLDKVEKAKKDLENDVMRLETKYAMSSNSHCKILKKKKKKKKKNLTKYSGCYLLEMKRICQD